MAVTQACIIKHYLQSILILPSLDFPVSFRAYSLPKASVNYCFEVTCDLKIIIISVSYVVRNSKKQVDVQYMRPFKSDSAC